MIATALPDGFQTPFDQTAALKEGKGTMACYTQCRADCAEHHGKLLDTEPGYISGQDTTFESSTSSSSSRADVKCAVSFADVLQYAGAASVEVTGGPKLLRHVKVRVAPSGIEPSTAEHPTAGRAPFHAPVVLCFPPRRRMRSRFLPRAIDDVTLPPPLSQPGRCDAAGPDGAFILPSSIGQSVADMVNTIPFFKQCHCGGTSHLVALSGAHTLGHAHSRHVTDWCVEESLPNTENARNMDTTPGVFDNTYWKHVTRAECPRHRKRANHYDRCTAPYLADSYAQETWPRLQPTKQDCGEPYAWNNTNDALFFDRWGDTCDPREQPSKCANVTSLDIGTCR